MALRKKIAVVIGTLDRGGAERDILRNFPRLDPDRFDVVAIAFNEPGALAPELEAAGLRVLSRDIPRPAKTGPWLVRRARDLFYALGLIPWLGRTYVAEKLDVAHFFLPYSYAFGMIAARLYRPQMRTVMSRLSLNFYAEDHPLLHGLELHWLHKRVDAAVANTQAIAEELAAEGVAAAKIRVVHNGVDVVEFSRTDERRADGRAEFGIAEGEVVVAAVGNLHGYKGHDDLIDACAQLATDVPWRVLIAGRDETGNRARLEARARDLGLAERLTFLGELESVAELLAAADLFVHPSHHEGLPNAVVEAMAAALPVVATRVGGIPEAVLDSGEGRCGWLVAPNRPGEIAAALGEAIDDGGLRKRYGDNARLRAKALFSIERSVADYEDLYATLR